jgi:hypothetical protein
MRACEWDIPTVVLIRSPYDAIVSRIALNKEVQLVENGTTVPRQRVSFAAWLHAWLSFYRAVGPYRKQEDLLVVPFSVVIQDMGRVIEHVNARFDTSFVPFDHTEKNVAAVHSDQGYHAGPSDQRGRLKTETRTDFDNALRTDDTLQRRLAAADQLFTEYVEGAAIGDSDEM